VCSGPAATFPLAQRTIDNLCRPKKLGGLSPANVTIKLKIDPHANARLADSGKPAQKGVLQKQQQQQQRSQPQFARDNSIAGLSLPQVTGKLLERHSVTGSSVISTFALILYLFKTLYSFSIATRFRSSSNQI
jgi:hypothetical protein